VRLPFNRRKCHKIKFLCHLKSLLLGTLVADLKDMCRERGLSTVGKKAELVERLVSVF